MNESVFFVIGMIVAVVAFCCIAIEIIRLFNGKIRYQ